MSASLPARLLLGPIRFYQRQISPSLPATCRYYPTCSSYAAEALIEHGALRGTWLAIRRLGRCHPWHSGGMDPVPPARERKSRSGSSVIVNSVAGTCEIGQIPAATCAEFHPDARPATAAAPNPRSNAA
ncbi:putative membrane protein insertion efficiency factor [Nakamurella sp. UYEF19]